jgi:hypothetical protein
MGFRTETGMKTGTEDSKTYFRINSHARLNRAPTKHEKAF